VPSLFINGEWIASGNGERSTVINPSDATVVTEVDVATDAHGTVWINDYNTYLPQAEWAASSSRAWAGSWVPAASTSTARPSTSGRTCRRDQLAGSAANLGAR
jgi:hypothetical protein